jgi:aspartyl-tRNA synthetase
LKSNVEFRVLEDKEDLTEIKNIASEATRKGFQRAKKIAHEIVIVQNGRLVRKRSGKPNEFISKLEERQVIVGQTTPLEF